MIRILQFLALILVANFSSCTTNTNKHQLQSFVYDNEKILLPDQKKYLDSTYRCHESKTTNEIVLVTTPDFGKFANNLLFAVNFGTRMGVGKIDYDNGVIISFSKAKRDIFIATSRGTERKLKDEIVKKIIDSLMIPKFKQGHYFEGLKVGSKAIVEFLEKPVNRIEKQKK